MYTASTEGQDQKLKTIKISSSVKCLPLFSVIGTSLSALVHENSITYPPEVVWFLFHKPPHT